MLKKVCLLVLTCMSGTSCLDAMWQAKKLKNEKRHLKYLPTELKLKILTYMDNVEIAYISLYETVRGNHKFRETYQTSMRKIIAEFQQKEFDVHRLENIPTVLQQQLSRAFIFNKIINNSDNFFLQQILKELHSKIRHDLKCKDGKKILGHPELINLCVALKFEHDVSLVSYTDYSYDLPTDYFDRTNMVHMINHRKFLEILDDANRGKSYLNIKITQLRTQCIENHHFKKH